MDKSRLILLTLFLLLYLTAVALAQDQSSPNVVLIMTDDQGWGDLGSHQNPYLRTPNIDRLAESGGRFENFYVSPLCAPTRASLLTGRYHLRTGVVSVSGGWETMRAEELTLAEVLKSNGYATGIFGKWHNGEHYPNDPNGQGFDKFVGFYGGHLNNYFDATLQNNGKAYNTKGYITNVITDNALDFIDRNKGNPFFCYIPYNAPHSPFQVPDKYYDYYKSKNLNDTIASIYGMVENIDDNVGRLLKQISKWGLDEKTIVVFLTDNGPTESVRYNGHMKGVKGQVDEGGIRVPCMISWKGKIKSMQTIPSIAAHIDLFPTILELCGLKLPSSILLDGKSQASYLLGKTKVQTDRMIFSHTSGFKILKPLPFPGTVRTQQYRLTLKPTGVQLYDMQADPKQRFDISLTKPLLKDSLERCYNSWFEEVTQRLNSPPLIPVGYLGKSVLLQAPEAKLSRNVKFYNKQGWANDWVCDWKEVKDTITWKVKSNNQAKYNVWVEYNCKRESVGSVVSVSTSISTAANQIKDAFYPPFNQSPDRVKRIASYEKKWKKLSLGQIVIPAGESKIMVSLQKVNGNESIELKSILLEPK